MLTLTHENSFHLTSKTLVLLIFLSFFWLDFTNWFTSMFCLSISQKIFFQTSCWWHYPIIISLSKGPCLNFLTLDFLLPKHQIIIFIPCYLSLCHYLWLFSRSSTAFTSPEEKKNFINILLSGLYVFPVLGLFHIQVPYYMLAKCLARSLHTINEA